MTDQLIFKDTGEAWMLCARFPHNKITISKIGLDSFMHILTGHCINGRFYIEGEIYACKETGRRDMISSHVQIDRGKYEIRSAPPERRRTSQFGLTQLKTPEK